jgi:hypothetical protein
MSRTVSFDSIYNGFSPSFCRNEIAKKQLFFVDAGRGFIHEAQSYLDSVTKAFNLNPTGLRDTRTAPIFYSSVAGGFPFSRVGNMRMTVFGEILLD